MCRRAIAMSLGLILVAFATKGLANHPGVEVFPLNKAADLDLSGEILYAINFGNNGNPNIGGVVFSQASECPGVTRNITEEGVITNWTAWSPRTGDPALDMLLSGLMWRNSSGPGGRTLSISAPGLVIGRAYAIQLIIVTDHSRPMDILVEEQMILERYDPYAVQRSVTPMGGTIIRYVFTAEDDTLNITLTPWPDDGSLASTISGLVVTRLWPPSPDFNGDYRVDIEDLLILIEHWGQNVPSLDLAPPPAGDGIIDRQDLEVFMTYWGKELPDPTLLAHWPLDETEGVIAHDLVGGNHATVIGVPFWWPEDGKVGGALELDGSTFATADSPVHPANRPFSVLAWIQGGAPGQVILSEQDGANWLMADSATGALMTDLAPPGRTAPTLISEAVITDGDWHRIAFAWDGASRKLYVDGVLVAEDARDNLPRSTGELVFGAGKDMAPGTFFTGLIDDVRVYRRAVKP